MKLQLLIFPYHDLSKIVAGACHEGFQGPKVHQYYKSKYPLLLGGSELCLGICHCNQLNAPILVIGLVLEPAGWLVIVKS